MLSENIILKTDKKISLYPLRFIPRFVEKPWGGYRIRDEFGFAGVPDAPCGEAWLLSAVPGNETAVANGVLKGNSLADVYEIFMEDLVGEKVYARSPGQFPLLIKILDANEWLSVQVHPDDKLAGERYGTTGKTEMWYILDAAPGAQLISGFNRSLDPDTLVFVTDNGLLPEVLNYVNVKREDVFFTPAGRVHAIGPGILLAEIQQTSDVTYRLFDWGRTGTDGKSRATHLLDALEAVDFNNVEDVNIKYRREQNCANLMVNSYHFRTDLLPFNKPIKNDYSDLDSFVILLFTRGEGIFVNGEHRFPYRAGEVLLLPANTTEVELIPIEVSETIQVRIL